MKRSRAGPDHGERLPAISAAASTRRGLPTRSPSSTCATGTTRSRLTYAALDAECDAVARGLLAQGLAGRRPGRHPVAQPARAARRLLRHHARRPRRRADLLQARARDRRLHRRGCRICAPSSSTATAPIALPAERAADRLRRRRLATRRCRIPARSRPSSRGRGSSAMMLYTSGSTGKPKGVLLSHESQRWSLERIDGALRRPLAPSLHRRRADVPHERDLQRQEALCRPAPASCCCRPSTRASTPQAIERFSVTWLTSVPTMLALVARERDLLGEPRFLVRQRTSRWARRR